MADVSKMPKNAFGYVPTPALVAPVEFTMRLQDYEKLGGHLKHVKPLTEILAGGIGDQNDHELSGRELESTANHGPIDLIIHAEGSKAVIDKAHSVACRRFETVLPELVTELTALRMPVSDGIRFSGTVARRMRVAAKRFSAAFMTPMIAVAGAVADEVLSEIIASVEGLQSVSV